MEAEKDRSGNGINIVFIYEISKKHTIKKLVKMLKISNSKVLSPESENYNTCCNAYGTRWKGGQKERKSQRQKRSSVKY